MKFIYVAKTEAGLVKKINQDSLLIQHVKYKGKEGLLAVVCDGVGGLEQGEFASASIVYGLRQWICERVIRQDGYAIEKSLEECLRMWNQKLYTYAKEHHVRMATTCSLLFIWNGEYIIVHVGDSRIYELQNNHCIQLTKDQSYHHALLQSIGYQDNVVMETCREKITGDGFLVCSDGMYRTIQQEELQLRSKTKFQMKQELDSLFTLCKERQETDNISAIWIRIKMYD